MLLYPRVGFGHHLGTIGRKSTIKTEGKRNAENSQKRSVYAGFRRFPFPQPTLNHLVRERKILLFFIVSVLLLCAIVAIVLAIHSAKMLIDIYKPKEFQAVNIQLLNNNEKLSKNPPTEFLLELIDHYQAIILNNSEVNSKKADLLNKQFIKAIIIFGLLSVSASGILICTGI